MRSSGSMEQSALSVPGRPAKAPFLKKGGAFLVLRAAVPVSTRDAVNVGVSWPWKVNYEEGGSGPIGSGLDSSN